MKRILTIKLLFLTAILFSQNKHSELYNQVETISRIVLKCEIDSVNIEKYSTKKTVVNIDSSKRTHWYCEAAIKPSLPLLIIDEIHYEDFKVLDTINSSKIVSFNVLKGSMMYTAIYGSRALSGIIILRTSKYNDQLQTKKKKRKSKSNN
jgi:hypothetical protein